MRRLSPIDTAFLLAEHRRQPLHVAGVSVFRPPAGTDADFVRELANGLRQSTATTAPFNQRLQNRRGLKFWVDEEDFDLDQHFVHLSLPRPGRPRDLLALVSHLHSAPLDPAYPLWRTYLIDGLEGGRIAVYSKMHHAMVDGVAGIRLMLGAMSNDREMSMRMPAPWALPDLRAAGDRRSQVAAGKASKLMQTTRDGAISASKVLTQVGRTIRDFGAAHPDLVTSFQAPKCMLNARITGSRRFVAQSYPTVRIKAIAEVHDATCNDVVLALCGSALRRYLKELGKLPDKPLVAAVPVSVRCNNGHGGNEFAVALAHLGTNYRDPIKRLQAVKGSMDYAKAVLQEMTQVQIMAYTAAMLAPGAATLIPGIAPARTPANVVISHVRGPAQDMYWQGCRLDGVYPASLVLDGFALNITLIRRYGHIDMGVVACRNAVPGVQRLLGHFEDAIAELELALRLPLQTAGPQHQPMRLHAA